MAMMYKLCLRCDDEVIYLTHQKTRLTAVRFFCQLKNMPVRDLLTIYKVVPYTRPIAGGLIHASN